MSSALAATAAREYRGLIASARGAVQAGHATREEAEERAQCWLAIACRAGADLPELAMLLPAYRRAMICRPRLGWQEEEVGEDDARRDCAEAIRPRSVWAPMLRRAAERASDKASDARSRERADDLMALAFALGAIGRPAMGEAA